MGRGFAWPIHVVVRGRFNQATMEGVITVKDRWETPDEVFRPLAQEFGFTLDACAEHHTAKCRRYYTEAEDGLNRPWAGEIVWCNPPYSHGNIGRWMQKCAEESERGVTVVALIPAATSSRWFHAWVYGRAELRFLSRRVRFVGGTGPAPFHSIVAVFRGKDAA